MNRNEFIDLAKRESLALFNVPRGTAYPTGWDKIGPGDVSDLSADVIAVNLCRSGVVVVDIDPRNGGSRMEAERLFGPLPPTFEVATGSGGTHLYFRRPDLSRYGVAELRPKHVGARGIDLLGDGSNAVAPTSDRPASAKKPAGLYTVVDDAPFAEVPIRLLAAWIGGPVGEHLTNVADTADAEPGCRDDTATSRIMSSVRKAVRGYVRVDVVREDYERHVPYEIRDLDQKFRSAIRKADTDGSAELGTDTRTPSLSRDFEVDVENAVYQTRVREEAKRRLNPDADAIRLLSMADIENLPDQQWLIGDVIPTASTAVLYAEWGTGKSFVALDWCLCMSAGIDWHGHAVRPGRALYIACEGAHGFRARIAAWKSRYGPADDHMTLVPEPVNLLNRSSVDRLTEIVREGGYDLVVFDTLNLVSGGEEENSSTAMGGLMAAATEIRSANPSCVSLILHHENRSGEIRGSSAIPSNADTLIRISPTSGEFVMRVEKQKDGATGAVGKFRLDPELESMVVQPVYSAAGPFDAPEDVVIRALQTGPADSERDLIRRSQELSDLSRADIKRGIQAAVDGNTITALTGGPRNSTSYSLSGR